MTSREELLALAAQLDADGASQHVQFQAAEAPQPASEAAQRRKRACELVRANEAARLLGLQVPSTPSSSTPATPAAPPAWPCSELPVLPPPKSLKRRAPAPKVPRAVRNGVVARLAAEHALLLAASAPAAPAGSRASSPASLLAEAVRGSAPLRRAAAALALRQEEASLFGPSTGKETYLARARAATALSARTSAAEVHAALESSRRRERGGGGGDRGGGGEDGSGDKKRRRPAPDPNPTPLPVLREQQREREEKRKAKEDKKRKEEPQTLPLPPQLEEEPIDWETAAAAPPQQRQRHHLAALPSPRSAISAVVSAALAPFVEGRQVSREAAAASAARATSKVLASFLVTPLAAVAAGAERREGKAGALNAAVAAFLTDSQRGKISQFARKCLFPTSSQT